MNTKTQTKTADQRFAVANASQNRVLLRIDKNSNFRHKGGKPPQHSPLPWNVYHLPKGKATGDGQLEIQSGEFTLVAYTPTEGDNPRGFARRKANAKLIVASVNHAEALAKALNDILDQLQDQGWVNSDAGMKGVAALANWEKARHGE